MQCDRQLNLCGMGENPAFYLNCLEVPYNTALLYSFAFLLSSSFFWTLAQRLLPDIHPHTLLVSSEITLVIAPHIFPVLYWSFWSCTHCVSLAPSSGNHCPPFSQCIQLWYSSLACGNHSSSHSAVAPDTQAVCFPSLFRFRPHASTLISCLSNAGPLGKVWNEGKNSVTGKVPTCLPCYRNLLQILERNFPAYNYREGQCPFVRCPILWSISYRCCQIILL